MLNQLCALARLPQAIFEGLGGSLHFFPSPILPFCPSLSLEWHVFEHHASMLSTKVNTLDAFHSPLR